MHHAHWFKSTVVTRRIARSVTNNRSSLYWQQTSTWYTWAPLFLFIRVVDNESIDISVPVTLLIKTIFPHLNYIDLLNMIIRSNTFLLGLVALGRWQRVFSKYIVTEALQTRKWEVGLPILFAFCERCECTKVIPPKLITLALLASNRCQTSDQCNW